MDQYNAQLKTNKIDVDSKIAIEDRSDISSTKFANKLITNFGDFNSYCEEFLPKEICDDKTKLIWIKSLYSPT